MKTSDRFFKYKCYRLLEKVNLIFLCTLFFGEIGFPDRAFNACEMEKTVKHQNDFLNLDMPVPSDAVIRREVKNETVIFLRGENLSQGLEKDKSFRQLQSKNLLAEIALAFLTAHRTVFKLVRPPEELIVSSVTTDDLGLKHVRFQQVFQGISVWASEIIVHLNEANRVYLMQGRYVPTPENMDTRPLLKEVDVFRIVAEDLKNMGPDCRNCRSELIVFAQAEDISRLAYRVLATPSLTEGWEYLIDANTGDILKKLTTVYKDKGGILPMQMKERKTDE